jgi:hypothetical protein
MSPVRTPAAAETMTADAVAAAAAATPLKVVVLVSGNSGSMKQESDQRRCRDLFNAKGLTFEEVRAFLMRGCWCAVGGDVELLQAFLQCNEPPAIVELDHIRVFAVDTRCALNRRATAECRWSMSVDTHDTLCLVSISVHAIALLLLHSLTHCSVHTWRLCCMRASARQLDGGAPENRDKREFLMGLSDERTYPQVPMQHFWHCSSPLFIAIVHVL